MSLSFNSNTKKILTLLILAPAYAAISTGTSMRKENKRSDAIDKSLYDVLYKAFHGDSSNSDQASFVSMFTSMSGPFQALIDKGYVTVSTLQVTQSQQPLSGVKEEIRIDLSAVLRCSTFFSFPSDLEIKLRKSTLKSNCTELTKRRTLQRWFNEDKKYARKIMILEKKFLDGNGDLPSGKNVDDLVDSIWSHLWKSYCEEKKKKEEVSKEKRKEELNEPPESENDSDSDEDDGPIPPVPLPQSAEIAEFPRLVLDGKWHPPGFPVYYFYVCKFTRINDDYIHLFACDGKTLDASRAMSRKEERQKISKKKEIERATQLKNGKNRGVDAISKSINEMETKMNLLDEANSLTFQANSISQMILDSMEFMKLDFGTDILEMKKSDQWKDILEMKKKRKELNESITKKRKAMEQIDHNKSKRKSNVVSVHD